MYNSVLIIIFIKEFLNERNKIEQLHPDQKVNRKFKLFTLDLRKLVKVPRRDLPKILLFDRVFKLLPSTNV